MAQEELSPNEQLRQAMARQDLTAMMLALDAGANPALQSPDGDWLRCGEGKSLLHHVARCVEGGKYVQQCLDSGIPVDDLDGMRREALMYACGYAEPTRILLQAGADPKHLDEYEDSVLSFPPGCDGSESLKLLLEAGADPNHENEAGNVPLDETVNEYGLENTRTLLQYGAEVNRCDFSQRRALHTAAEKGLLEMAQLLVEFGADVHARDSKGRSPADLARLGKKIKVQAWLQEQENN